MIKQIQERLWKIAGRPWRKRDEQVVVDGNGHVVAEVVGPPDQQRDTLDFIAHAPSEVAQLIDLVERLQDESVRWCSTASAAADEIEEHWEAHVDAEGAGPINLIRRLRNRPDYYPGSFEEQAEELDRVKAVLRGANLWPASTTVSEAVSRLIKSDR
jgi:hypothetical protein